MVFVISFIQTIFDKTSVLLKFAEHWVHTHLLWKTIGVCVKLMLNVITF